MKVNSLCLDNFRNYNHFFIEFDRDINILIGSNGQGKTNLIEAIYLLSVGKSFKTHINKQMIMFDCEFAKVKGEVTSNNKLRSLEMILGSDFKRAKIDDQDIYKISEYVGLLNVVVFVPDDLYLIKGSPNNRRRFIDLELSKISPIYVFNLSKYNNLLKERNKYLKILNQKNRDGDEYLEVLDEQMARLQVELIKKRIDFIKNLNQKVTSIYNLIAKNDNEKISLRYRCFLKQELTYENILALYKKSGLPLKRFFNTSGLKYRELNLKDKLSKMSEDEQLSLLASDGMLVKRPIVESSDKVLVGFKPAEYDMLK